MPASNEEIALVLLADATVQPAADLGKSTLLRREGEQRQAVQRAAQARQQEVRDAFRSARTRAFLLTPLWFILSVSLGLGVAGGSWQATTLICAALVIGALAVDVRIGPGRNGALLAGAACGWFAMPLVSSMWGSTPPRGQLIDLSFVWLPCLSGLIGYLISSLHNNRHR